MELKGISPEGDAVKATIPEFIEKMQKPMESYSFGHSPTQVIYTDRSTNAQRTVDLQEVAQAAGIRNVSFHFDVKQAKDAGLYEERDIDQSVAYNLERIKTDGQRLQYLKDKGYANPLRNGDDFYTYENGKIYPINNKGGFDLSDFVRMGAHAGRDIGAALGATAAVGGAAVGAVPTLGTSVVAGVAGAAAAGVAGGVTGEAMQRVGDKLLGAEADKYNQNLTGTEEGMALAGDAAMSGIAGAAQPLMALGGAALKTGVIAPALEKLGGEWAAGQAAKLQAQGALARMPQGYMQRFATEEQMSAQAMLNDGMSLLKDKALSAEGMNAVTAEAKALASGAAKPVPDAAEELFFQQGLRQKFESQTIQQAKSAQYDRMFADAQAAAGEADKAAFIEKQKQHAFDFFGKSGLKKDLETIFDAGADIDASRAAQQRVVAGSVQRFASSIGVKLEKSLDGEVVGFESASFKRFADRQFDEVFGHANDVLNSQRASAAFFNRTPDGGLKGVVSKEINASVGALDAAAYSGTLRPAARELVEAIAEHGPGQTDRIRAAAEAFQSLAVDVADNTRVTAKTREAMAAITRSLQKYELGSTDAPAAVNGYYAGLNKLVEVKSIFGVNRGAHTPDVFERVVVGAAELSKTVGDHDASLVRPLIEASHLDQILTGEANANPVFRAMLNPAAREKMDSLQFVREFGAATGKDRLASGTDQQKRLVAAVGGGIIGKMTGMGFAEGAAAGYVSGNALPGNVSQGLKMLGRAGETTKAVLGKSAAASTRFASDVLDRAPGTTAAKAGFGKNLLTTGTEEEGVRRMNNRGTLRP